MVQVPTVTSVTELPVTVHTGAVNEAKLTLSGDDVVAEIDTGETVKICAEIAGKVIVCAIGTGVI